MATHILLGGLHLLGREESGLLRPDTFSQLIIRCLLPEKAESEHGMSAGVYSGHTFFSCEHDKTKHTKNKHRRGKETMPT